MSNPQQILNKLKTLKEKSDSPSNNRSKGTITGSVIGMAGGALLALSKGYSVITSIFVGGILGGLVTHLILPSTDEDEEE